MSVITGGTCYISNGEVVSGLTADTSGEIYEIDVLSGGTLTDSLATDYGWIVVDNGGIIQRASATEGGDLFIGGNASDLTAETSGMFDIDSGGSLNTGLVKSGGMGAIYADAIADNITVLDGGKLLNYGGTIQNTTVLSGGSFTVQFATAMTANTKVMDGATMRITEAGNATNTKVSGGFLEIESGTAANTVVSAGSMRVNKSNTVEGVTLLDGKLELNEAKANATVVSGGSVLVYSSGSVSGTTMTDGSFDLFSGTATKTVMNGGTMRVHMSNSISDTTLNNGELTLSAASADTTVMNGGVMQIVSGGTFSGTTVNAGQLTMDKGATFTDTMIQGGTANFMGAAVTNIEIGSGGTVTMDSESILGGLAVFTVDASISIDGTVAFDTALATAETAQIKGFSVATTGENTAYTLTDEATIKGTYLLASDAATFNSDVVFGDYTLRVNTPVIVGDILSYTLNITESNDLALVIADKPDVPPLVYVNSEWTGLEKDTIVEVKVGTAKIGYDAFALLADGIAGVTIDGTVEVCGGTISFADGYSKTIVVDAEASVVGTATFDKPITINGTVVFDTTIATEATAQFGGFSNVAGDATYILTVPEVDTGTWLLASDAATFDSDVIYNEYTLKVGEPVIVGNALTYTLNITDNNELALTIAEYTPPPPTTPTQTYANSNWVTRKDGDIVIVTGGTAVIGYDAFATLDAAIAGVTEDGKINVTGGEVSFANGYSKTITVDAGATVVGKGTFDKAITVNGTFAFDTANASATIAQFGGFSFIAGNTTYTLTDTVKTAGTYLLASDAATFNSNVVFNDVTLKIGAEAIEIGDFTYALAITDNNDLALLVADKPAPPPPTTPTQTYANSEWAGLSDGTIVPVAGGTAKIGYDAFATLEAAIAGVTEDGKINIVGGEITFGEYSKTITVDAGATVVGKNTFDKVITINGTNAFDTAIATADATQFTGCAFTTGDAAYTLTVTVPVTGTYLLADNAAGFNSDVVFNDVTLKVGEEAVVIGDFTYALAITNNNDLALLIADKPTPPPTPTEPAKSDIDGNGISDVMFVWTGNNYQHGYWMNGTSEWQSANSSHPAEWENLGCYDMTANGKADSVLVGNVVVNEVKGAYIGFYTDAIDNPDGSTWQNIGYLTNADDIAWKNKVGNLTGNENANSIVWYAPELYAVGAWTNGTENWVTLSNSFGGADWTLVGCGDFDGDGKDSVLMSGLNGNYFYTVGIEEEAKSLGLANWTGWEVRAIGDFSGDAKDDMVLFHKETGSMVMCADGNIDSFVSLAQLDANDWFVVGAGDYNGDQKDDLLVRQYSTGMLGYYNSGDTAQWVELGRGVDMNWTVIA